MPELIQLNNKQDLLHDQSLSELQGKYGKINSNSIKKINLDKVILDYTALLEAQLPERKLLLPWLPEGGLVMVSAERGIGKTFFALSFAYSLSTGKKFMHWEVLSPTGVLYVDGEMALVEIRERLQSLVTDLPQAPLKILSHEWFYDHCERDLTITDAEMQLALLEQLDNDKTLRVVVLDNLSSLTQIREDKGDDWRFFMLPFLIACRRRGVAVVFIHHCNKAGDQRGTGAREDHINASIKLTKPDNSQQHEGCCFKVTFTKARGCHGNCVEPFIAKLIDTDSNKVSWEISNHKDSIKDQLVALIRERHPVGIAAANAAKLLDVSRAYISQLKDELEAAGILKPSTGKIPMQLNDNKDC